VTPAAPNRSNKEAAGKGADDANYDVEQGALPGACVDLARDEACNQAENQPAMMDIFDLLGAELPAASAASSVGRGA